MQIEEKNLVLGGGCFWCLEAAFQRCEGVLNVTPGYTDGDSQNPTYIEVSNGETGHAEVVQINYDQSIISLTELLDVFFLIHDPTTLNQQGADQGTQYRSIICYQNDQEQPIKDYVKQIQLSSEKAIVTQIKPMTQFYPAEVEHKDYYERNSSQSYCQIVIKPKLDKVAQWKKDKS